MCPYLMIDATSLCALQMIRHFILLQELYNYQKIGKRPLSWVLPERPLRTPLFPLAPSQELNKHVHFVPGVPVKPMLAKPTLGISEVLDKFQDTEFTCEYKYDGERAQVHVMEGALPPFPPFRPMGPSAQAPRPVLKP